MGCQCAKGNEKSNMNLETAPPKSNVDVEAKNEILQNSKANDTVNQSKVDNSRVDDSKVKGKKKKKKTATTDNFAEELYNQINRVRANPAEFASKIEEAIANIKTDEGKIVFDADGTKVALTSGESAFRAAADKLRNTSPAPPLEFKPDLIIAVPEDQKEWKNQKNNN